MILSKRNAFEWLQWRKIIFRIVTFLYSDRNLHMLRRTMLALKIKAASTILTKHSKHFLNVVIVHWRGRPSRFGVVFDGRSARFETLVPLVTLHTAQTIFSISLLQHLKSFRKSFSQFETEFDANASLLKILHFSTCKKSPRVLNTHSFKRWLLDD